MIRIYHDIVLKKIGSTHILFIITHVKCFFFFSSERCTEGVCCKEMCEIREVAERGRSAFGWDEDEGLRFCFKSKC